MRPYAPLRRICNCAACGRIPREHEKAQKHHERRSARQEIAAELRELETKP